MTPEEKQRLAYIEGRPELFETKILRLESSGETEQKNSLLVSSRDPGSGNALLPVIENLSHDPGLEIDIVTDGRAQEIFQKNLKTQDITPEEMFLKADKVIGRPKVILMDRSLEMGIDTYTAATFPEVPKILLGDHYNNPTKFLSELIARNLPLPEKICVMDEAAKKLITKKFPELADRIEITGQPAFDRFVQEDTEKIAQLVKEKLGLQSTDKLVSFMSTRDEPEKIRQVAEAIRELANDFYLAFRRHPRDNVSYENYRQIFTDAGIRLLDTEKFSTNDIGAASDLILTTWSTEGLHGIYRRKPTVHLVDRNFRIPDGLDLPLIPVKLGASVGIKKADQLKEILPQLLDANSELNNSLREKMEQNYPADGKNAERVANVVRQYI